MLHLFCRWPKLILSTKIQIVAKLICVYIYIYKHYENFKPISPFGVKFQHKALFLRSHLASFETRMEVIDPTQPATLSCSFQTYHRLYVKHSSIWKLYHAQIIVPFLFVSRHLQTWNLCYEVPSAISKQVHVKNQLNIFMFSPRTLPDFLLRHFSHLSLSCFPFCWFFFFFSFGEEYSTCLLVDEK